MAGFGAKVRLKVDNSAAARTEFNNQIQGLIDKKGISVSIRQLTLNNDAVAKFRKSIETRLNASKSITLSKINCKPAIDDMRSQLQSMINSLSIKNGVTISGLADPGGAGSIGTKMDDVAEETKRATKHTKEYSAELKLLHGIQSAVAGMQKTIFKLPQGTEEHKASVQSLIDKYNELQAAIAKASNSDSLSQTDIEQLQQKVSALNQEIEKHRETAKASSAASASKKKDADKELATHKEIATLIERIQRLLKNNSKLNGTVYGNAMKSMLATLQKGGAITKAQVKQISDELLTVKANAESAGKMGRSVFDWLGKAIQKFGGWSLVTRAMMAALRITKQMISTVIDLDTAMTELKKVTDESDATYERFLKNATKRAKEFGASLTDVVSTSADFARLGYDIEDAAVLADAALVYKNVGDGIEDVNDASESIISTMQAFGIEAENVMAIVDRFNAVGNNFAVSSGGIGEAMLRSASAMQAAGNTIDETVALIAAANTIVQDPEKVGTTLKTLSMFLRAAKTEAEEAGESTDGMASSVSALRAEILSLTGQRVDIQIDENNFKSTYQIIKELSGVWDELTDISQANILELIGGKRNANVTAALMENFDIASKAVQVSAESAGSALRENEIYLDSLQGKLSEFSATFQELATDVFDEDFLATCIDIGTALLEIVDLLDKAYLILPMIAATMTAIRAMRIDASTGVSSVLGSILNETKEHTVDVAALTSTVDGLTAAERRLLKTRIDQAVANNVLEKDRAEELMQLIGLTASTHAQAGANYSLASSLKAVTLASPMFWITTAISLLPMLIDGVKALIKTNDELIAQADEIRNKYSDTASEVKENIETLNSYKDEFSELSKGVSDSGENISLTADQYARYNEIIQSIADISPRLIQGWDAEGNAILSKNGVLEDGNDLLEEAIRLEKERQRLAAIESTSDLSLQDTIKGVSAARTEIMRGLYDDLASLDNATAIDNIAAAITGNKISDYTDNHYTHTAERELFNVDWSSVDINKIIADARGTMLDWEREQVSADDIADLITQIQAYTRIAKHDMESEGQKLNAQMKGIFAEHYSKYDSLNDLQKDVLNSYVDSFEITEDNYSDVKAAVERMLGIVSDKTGSFFAKGDGGLIGSKRLNKAIDDALDFSDEKSDLTLEEYSKRIAEVKNEVETLNLPQEVKVTLLASYGVKTDTLTGETYDDVTDAAEAIRGRIKEGIDQSMLDALTTEQVLHIATYLDSKNITTIASAEQFAHIIEQARKFANGNFVVSYEKLASAFNSSYENLQALYDALEGLDGATALDMETYTELVELMPELAGEITDVKSAQDALNKAINDSKHKAVSAYGEMMLGNSEWISNTINSTAGLSDALKACYAEDLTNWNGVATAKWVTDSGLVKNLSELWTEYSGHTKEALEQEIAIYEEWLEDIGRGYRPEEGTLISEGRYKEIKIYLSLLEKATAGYDSIINGSKTGSSLSKYIADIDAYREALERLRKAEEHASDIESDMDETENLREKIKLRKQLTDAYYEQQMALHNLNNERDATIQAGVDRLNKLGFEATYDAVNNELWIDNIEILNKLQATSQGTYGSMQEATNAYRKEIEELIDELENLNDENRESSATWHELQSKIESTATDLYDLLDQVIQKASESVDEIQNVYSTLHQAADEYAQSGFITIDSMQAIIGLGHKYINYLMDENGQLIINEERIRAVVAARTDQYAIETSLAYVEALRVAMEAEDIATLNELLYSTETATEATWGLVYANLALLHLDDGQYQAALEHINAIRAMADSAISSIGRTTGSALSGLQDMQSGVDSILQYVMDMLRDQLDMEIEAIEDQKDAISELIDLKKEALDEDKEEADYQDEIADKLKEIAKLQAKIDALALDDSREAQAERAKLMEELAELQEELNDAQSDKAVEAQKEALDQMGEDYAEEKDAEIEKLEDSLSSQEKLYQAAIQYIQDHWDTLYNELIAWNTEYGSVLNDEITSAWNNCLAAAQRYGSYVNALHSLPGDIESAQSSGGSYQIGSTHYGDSHTNEEGIRMSVRLMKRYAEEWAGASEERREFLASENIRIATQDLPRYGLYGVTRGEDGVWYLPDGRKLFDVYAYHTGGIVGGGTAENRERLSLLLDDEWVLSKKMISNLVEQMDRIAMLTNHMRHMPSMAGFNTVMDGIKRELNTVTGTVTTTNQPIDISFGDIVIQGRADDGVVEKINDINRDFANQIIKIIKKK